MLQIRIKRSFNCLPYNLSFTMQYNPFLSSSNSIKRVLYRAETIYIIPYHQNSGLCSNAGQQKWTEAIPRSQKETNKPKLSLEEKQQLILSRSLKEFAIRQKRRQEGYS